MAHALLSASGSTRWLNCTPSPRLEQDFPDTTSVFAEEGTLAHELGELKLAKYLGNVSRYKYYKQLKQIKDNELYDKSMDEYTDRYCEFGIERLNEARSRSKDAIMFLEQRVDFSDYVPKGFGTGDMVVISDGMLEIIDLKYGKGIEVSAEDNTQMMLYALGALNNFEMLYDIEEVRMTVVQPRLDNISSWILKVDELYEWAEGYLKPRSKMAWDGEGEYVAGDHCKFCKAKSVCRARAEANMELAKYDFKKPATLEEDDIVEILAKLKDLTSWAKDVEKYVLDEALQGKKWPGYKVVEGRSNRKYSDDIKVANTLKEAGYDEEILFTKKLLGITKMEKTIGKKEFRQLLNDLVIKPQGKPALVEESDKRPEFNSVIDDFK